MERRKLATIDGRLVAPIGGILDHLYKQFDPAMLRTLRMEEETPEEKAAREKKEAEEQADKDGKFTQEQVNRIASTEKKEGRKAMQKEILDKLGFESIDDADEAIKGWKKKDEDAKDEETKRTEKLAADEAANAKDKLAAARDRREAAATKKLMASGLALPFKKDKDGKVIEPKELDEEAADKLLARAIKNLDLDFDKEFEGEDLTAAIADLRTTIPSFFDGDSGNGEKPGKGSGQGVPPPRPPSSKKPASRTESKERAASIREQMFPASVKPEK